MSRQIFAAAGSRLPLASSLRRSSRVEGFLVDVFSQLSIRRPLKFSLKSRPLDASLDGTAFVAHSPKYSRQMYASGGAGRKTMCMARISGATDKDEWNAQRAAELTATVEKSEKGKFQARQANLAVLTELGNHKASVRNLSQFPNRLINSTSPAGEKRQDRLSYTWNRVVGAREFHSAVSDSDENNPSDSEGYTLEREMPKNESRISGAVRRRRAVSFVDAESDDDMPALPSKKRSSSTLPRDRTRRVAAADTFASDFETDGLAKKVARRKAIVNEDDSESDFDFSEERTSVRKTTRQRPEPEEHQSGVPEDVESSPSHLTQTRFDKFKISPLSIKALHSVLKYERMTAVQEATFPVILSGQDVLAKARTGTGKTIAFLLPAIEVILKASQGESRNPVCVVIVCPTRELAQQAAKEAQVLLTYHKNLGAQVVYGGNPIRSEQMKLSRGPCQILVGTPGRLVDHIERTSELRRQLKSVKLFVLDEADHMLDMGFREPLRKIMQALPSQRQTLLFSATIPTEVHSIAKVALRSDHSFIDTVGKDSQDTHAKVKQQCVVVPLEKQLSVLYSMLKAHTKDEPSYKVLVFCTTARVTAFMCKLYEDLGFNSREIHSRKDQRYRTRVSDEFRNSKGGIILFTSDVSARGVDYPNVTLVVQVGAPSDLEQYIHRLGRTGRAGKKGEGLLVLAPWEGFFLEKLQKLPVTKIPVPELSSKVENKVLATVSEIDSKIRNMAYQAWIGYYKSLKGLTLDKVKLVHHANQFSSSMGFDEPPLLSRMLVSKMSLSGVPGIRVAR